METALMSPRPLAAAIALASLPLLSGCLISSHSNTEFSGRYIGAETMAQLEPGKTKEDFVVATIGTPTTKTTLEDGSEVWKYEYRKRTSGNGTVFLLLNTSNSTDKEGAVYVILKDGVVQKAWRD
jgi:outer membrane protein assembly factor BamE (lipoprotein component of BamABCDE complex)